MASAYPCIPLLEGVVGRKLTDEEVDLIFTEIRKRRDYIRAKDSSVSEPDANIQAANELSDRLQAAALIEKRNAAMDVVKRAEKVEWAKETFGDNIARSIETILVGTNFAKTGARDGVMNAQARLRKQYLAGMTNDLVQAGVHDVLSSGVLDQDIARALWAIGAPDEAMVHGKLNEDAVTVAKIINKWQEFSRLKANSEGAWIGKLEGYIFRQSHDPHRISGEGGFFRGIFTSTESKAAVQERTKTQWKQDAANLFDIPRTMGESPDGTVDGMLDRLYTDLASGNHRRLLPEEGQPTGQGTANLAKRVSQSREIYFKDADSFMEYNSKWGTRNLREAIYGGLNHSADATGLMEVLGTNPANQVKMITDELVEKARTDGNAMELARLNKEKGHIANYLAAVDGSMNIPGNAMWARAAANIRGFQTLAKLGSMIFSQLNDLANYASAMNYGGRSYLGSMAEAISGLGTNMKTPERMDLLSSLGVVFDSMVGELGRTGSIHDPGSMSSALQLFSKWNLSRWWTERLRASASLGLSNHMALQKAKSWGGLGEDYQRLLNTYGIGSAEWDQIRSAAAKHLDGNDYVTPEMVGGDVEQKLRNYFVDNTAYAVIDADAKTKAMMFQGSKPGTWPGEFARFIMQFKSWTGAYMQRSMGRELYGRGYEGDSLLGAMTHGNGELLGLARLIGVSTLFGYASLTLKDLVKNKSPRDISDPAIAWKTFLSAMIQGGGAGIYGDFLFGEANRFGGGFVDSLAGPTASQFGRIIDLYHASLRGDDVKSRVFSEALNNAPVINLFYSRMALDYLIVRDIQESMNPGYQRRMERRLEKEHGQHLLTEQSARFIR